MGLYSNLKIIVLTLMVLNLNACTRPGSSTPFTLREQGHYLYVTNYTDGSISQFTIDKSTGNLTPLCVPVTLQSPTIPCALQLLGNQPVSITFEPSGHYAYVTTFGNPLILTFSIDADTGQLTPVNAPIVLTGASVPTPTLMLFIRSGKYAYVFNPAGHNIYSYSFDPNTGVLTPLVNSPFTPQSESSYPSIPGGMAMDPTGNYLYISDMKSGQIQIMSVNTSTGVLQSLMTVAYPGTDLTCTEGQGCNGKFYGTVFDPSGKYLLVMNALSNVIDTYILNPTNGHLTPATPFATTTHMTGTQDFIFDPSGQYAYALSTQNGGSIAALGNYIATPFQFLPLYPNPMPIAVFSGTTQFLNHQQIAFDPAGNYVYALIPISSKISMLNFDITSGQLSFLVPNVISSGVGPSAVAIYEGPTP